MNMSCVSTDPTCVQPRTAGYQTYLSRLKAHAHPGQLFNEAVVDISNTGEGMRRQVMIRGEIIYVSECDDTRYRSFFLTGFHCIRAGPRF
jgi:hypothetical protein